jgi:pyruvate-formate lyase
MPYPDIYGVFIRGTANAVDALTAFHELVEQRGYALDELLAGVDSRDPAVLDAIARAPKWGRDDEDAGGWGVALNARRDASLREAAQEAGLPPFTVCHVVRSLHHLDGRRLGPTLDGRATGEPVGESVGPVLGAQTIPPTAMLNSVLQLDADRWFTGVYNLNLTLPAGPRADAGVVRALAGAFFERGGQELQVNVLDAAKLRRAQRDPGAFRDLVVRVAGLNARFVELSPSEQEELIQRAEASQAATAPSRAIERCSRRR